MGGLYKLNVHIGGTEMMKHVLSNLPESYYNFLNLKNELDYEDNTLTIGSISYKLLVKYCHINVLT